VAYLVSRFPKLTETFVLYELLAVEREGLEVELHALQRERTRLRHPEAEAWLERAHFPSLLSPALWLSQLRLALRRPRAWFGTFAALLRAHWRSPRYLAGVVLFYPKMVRIAERVRASGVTHVHAHFASHPAAAAFAVGRLAGIPWSFTAHGSDLHRDRRGLREKVAEARFVVAISDYNREVLLRECGREAAARTLVLHCGVDTDLFRPPEGSGTTVGGRPLQVLCVGTLHEVKGQTHLVEACRRLAARGVEVRCDLLGDGPDRRTLEAQVERAGLSGRVRVLGTCTRPEVAARVSQADVVAAPSVPTRSGRREGIPVALMEAAACGRALVASRLSGIPELVEDGKTGLLVPPGDPGALADALERLAADAGLRAQLGREARARALAEFDLASNAARLVRAFRGASSWA
jgi:glycosyltransferase involved in cell wall biosynthesis